jgi:uncharacterized protein (DUF1501 family)
MTPTDSIDTCGCPEYATSRRRFLQSVGAIAGASVVLANTGGAFVQAAFASTGTVQNNVLVVLSLRGGADGLSLVVPWADKGYKRARPKIAIPTNTLLAKDTMFGLNPGFQPVMSLWNSGKMAAVHAVGLPLPNRSHFAAMEAVEDADPGSPERCGWLNRLIGLDTQVSPIEAVQMGSAMVPGSLYGPEPVMAIGSLGDMFLPGRDNPEGYARRVDSLKAAWQDAADPIGTGARSAISMSQEFADLAELSDDPLHGAVYPTGDLGNALSESAKLIRADMGAEVITIDAGAWDMHVSVGTLDGGSMVSAVDELAHGLEAFFKDLDTVADRVTVVTISEFGRRVMENDLNGLDHGYGNVMMLFGAGVIGGKYYGKWPGLGDLKLVDGDLAVTRDYRSVLSEVIKSRFNADISKVFPGFKREKIGVMQMT